MGSDYDYNYLPKIAEKYKAGEISKEMLIKCVEFSQNWFEYQNEKCIISIILHALSIQLFAKIINNPKPKFIVGCDFIGEKCKEMIINKDGKIINFRK